MILAGIGIAIMLNTSLLGWNILTFYLLHEFFARAHPKVGMQAFYLDHSVEKGCIT